MRSIHTAEILTVTLTSGIEVSALVAANLYHVNDYGADADGNRGVPTTFVEDVEIAGEYTTDGDFELSDKERGEAEARLLTAGYDHNWQID